MFYPRLNESLAERVERLERDAEEVRSELRCVNGKLDRVLSESEQGRGDTESETVSLFASEDRAAVEESAAEVPETERGSRLARQPEESQDDASGESGAGRGFGIPLNLGNFGDFRSGEWWLNKIGIGLLLFGVAFLYLLSVERGWIAPRCVWASDSRSAPRC